jgi:hypothetical protein
MCITNILKDEYVKNPELITLNSGLNNLLITQNSELNTLN